MEISTFRYGKRHVILQGRVSSGDLNLFGVVDSGWLISLIESALDAVVQTVIPFGVNYVLKGVDVNFITPFHSGVVNLSVSAMVGTVGLNCVTADAHVRDDTGVIGVVAFAKYQVW